MGSRPPPESDLVLPASVSFSVKWAHVVVGHGQDAARACSCPCYRDKDSAWPPGVARRDWSLLTDKIRESIPAEGTTCAKISRPGDLLRARQAPGRAGARVGRGVRWVPGAVGSFPSTPGGCPESGHCQWSPPSLHTPFPLPECHWALPELATRSKLKQNAASLSQAFLTTTRTREPQQSHAWASSKYC